MPAAQVTGSPNIWVINDNEFIRTWKEEFVAKYDAIDENTTRTLLVWMFSDWTRFES
jgi:hypothetical protein